jgi:hypothetical protein
MNILYKVSRTNKKWMLARKTLWLSYIISCILPKHVGLLYIVPAFFLKKTVCLSYTISIMLSKHVRPHYTLPTFFCNVQVILYCLRRGFSCAILINNKKTVCLSYIIMTIISKHVWPHYTLPTLKKMSTSNCVR